MTGSAPGVELNNSYREDPTSGGDGQRVTKEVTEIVDDLQKQLGGFGRYQLIIYGILGIIYMRGCWHALISIFQGLNPGYHCLTAPGLPLNDSVPGHEDSDGHWVYDKCTQYVNLSVNNHTEACSRGWQYLFDDNDTTSIVSEFDLTCDREYMIELSATMYMIGTTCGVLFLTPLTERFGAKWMMLLCLVLQSVVGTVLPWSGSIAIFMLMEFFIGVFNMTIALCVAVMMSETFDSSRRIIVLGTSFFWSAGIMILSLLAYLIRDWKTLQLAITLPANLFGIALIWVIPLSLPWLISKKRWKDARKLIDRFISINKLPGIPNLDNMFLDLKDQLEESPDHEEADSNIQYQGFDNASTTSEVYTIFHVLKFPKLRRYTLILCYLFLSNALAYFGTMYSTPLLDGNRFLNLFYSGLVEIPAYAISIVAHKFIGRRKTIGIFLFICAVSNIVISFVPDTTASGNSLTPLKTVLYLIGKFGITGSYSAIYLYASEIFPTVIRNQGVGFCSFFENIGSIAAPPMVLVSKERANLPLIIFGILAIIGSVLVIFLPETHQRPLPQTIEEVEDKQSPVPYTQTTTDDVEQAPNDQTEGNK